MSLFSWFIRGAKVKSLKNDKASLELELSIFNNNTMWPIAKVRENIIVQRQEYITSVSHLKNVTNIKTFTENTTSVYKQH
jgi:hypothetical protein